MEPSPPVHVVGTLTLLGARCAAAAKKRPTPPSLRPSCLPRSGPGPRPPPTAASGGSMVVTRPLLGDFFVCEMWKCVFWKRGCGGLIIWFGWRDNSFCCCVDARIIFVFVRMCSCCPGSVRGVKLPVGRRVPGETAAVVARASSRGSRRRPLLIQIGWSLGLHALSVPVASVVIYYGSAPTSQSIARESTNSLCHFGQSFRGARQHPTSLINYKRYQQYL